MSCLVICSIIMKLNIITVWHNEELNLSKFFESLYHFNDLMNTRVVYCDQWSTDKSLEIATLYHAEIYQHGKKWYCERSRKWCVDNLFQDWEWILVLDCDEEITKDLAKEIYDIITTTTIGIIKIPKNTMAFWMPVGIEYAIRLFKKWVIEVTDTIHEYIKIVNEPYIVLKNNLENNDIKESKWNEMFNWIEKANKYSEKDYIKYTHHNYWKLFLFLLLKPLESFLYYYIRHFILKYGMKWFIYSYLHAFYQFITIAKAIIYK